MLLIDDLLLLPAKGLVGIFKKVHNLAREELEDTPEKLQAELFNLQMILEAKQITEAEYQKKEKIILEKLNQIS